MRHEAKSQAVDSDCFHMFRVSDGTTVRIIDLRGVKEEVKVLVILPGWGVSPPLDSDWILTARENFRVVIVETREKASSVLSNGQCDLTRISNDIVEALDYLKIPAGNFVLYAYSWGCVPAANTLARRQLNPCLVVFGCPISSLPIPSLIATITSGTPAILLNLLKPLAKLWILAFKSKDRRDAQSAWKVIEEADVRKWMRVGRSILRDNFLSIYRQVPCQCVLARANGEVFHSEVEHFAIEQAIKYCISLRLHPMHPRGFDAQIIEYISSRVSSGTIPNAEKHGVLEFVQRD